MSKKISLNIVGQEVESVEPVEADSGVSRRSFLKGIGGTAAVAVTAGCADSSKQNVYPNVEGDSASIPGTALHYKSACTECSAGCGIISRVADGRVVTVVGNPDHPVNRGGLCSLGHSSLQNHYDPDRIRQPLEKVTDSDGNTTFKPITWSKAIGKVRTALGKKGKKAFITKPQSGSIAELIKEWSKEFDVEHFAFNPLDNVAIAEANAENFGDQYKGVPNYDFSKAEVVVNFGADFLETWVNPTGFARDWAKSRKSDTPVRVFQIEPRLSLTGANADHWLKCKPGTEIYLAAAILKYLVVGRNLNKGMSAATIASLEDISFDVAESKTGVKAEKIILAASKLTEAKQSLVLAGGAASAHKNAKELQSVVNLINVALGNVGKTINFSELRSVQTDFKAITKLSKDLVEGEYSVLFVDGANPVFKLPNSTKFHYGIKTLNLLVSFSSHLDETTKQADIILPSSSSFESWGDNVPYAGVHTIMQPVMTPIFDTKEFGDILLSVADKTELKKYASFYDYLRGRWESVYSATPSKEKSFDEFWNEIVEAGGYFDTSKNTAKAVPLVASASIAFDKLKLSTKDLKKQKFSLLPYPSIKTFDGGAANRPWMQELPDPLTKVAWDTWAEISPKTAKTLGVKTGDPLKVSNYHGELNIPVFVTEYVHDDVIAVPIGNGHTEYGRYAQSVGGGNVYDMLPGFNALSGDSGMSLLATQVNASKALGVYEMVRTQEYFDQGDRHLARTENISPVHNDEHHDDDGHHGGHHEPEQMYEQREHPIYKWGMGVDLAACTGCSACVTACYAENNIPTVGKDVMLQGREMSWLRIDTYFEQESEELQVSFLPMMCQHCQNAPCEPVCPVYATYHNEEGLNTMVYNRCVGTRYCANNCSYKVRRFNWFEFEFPEPLNMQLNPDVQKRVAGVMEKCSFCVHKIAEAKDIAKDQGRLVKDGEVQPACVSSCPTEALVFGDLNDPNSKVSKMAKHDRAYKVLDHHLNTQPSVSYLANRKYDAAEEA